MASAYSITGADDSVRSTREVFNNIPNEFKYRWIRNHPTIDDLLGKRNPSRSEQHQMALDWESSNQRKNRPIRDYVETMNGASNSMSALETVSEFQRAIMLNQSIGDPLTANGHDHTHAMGRLQHEARLTIGIERLNEEIRMYLERNHPDEEKFLQRLSGELRTTPMETILECIRVAMDPKSEVESVNDINSELKQLERNKKHELDSRIN